MGEEVQEKRGGCCGCRSCGCIFLLLLVALVGAGVYLYFQAPNLVIDWARAATVKAIEDSEIPADQKQAVIEQVNRLAEGVKERGLPPIVIVDMVQDMPRTPMFQVVLLQMSKQEIAKLDLEPEVTGEYLLAVQRAQRGLVEESFTSFALDDAFAHTFKKDDNGIRTLREGNTKEDWAAFAAALKEAADKAGVPEESYEVDLGVVVKQFVDQVLSDLDKEGEAAPAPAPQPEVEPAPAEGS